MRTDSLNIAKDAIDSVREYILNNFSKEYLPNRPKDTQQNQKQHKRHMKQLDQQWLNLI